MWLARNHGLALTDAVSHPAAKPAAEHLNELVLPFARQDFTVLPQDFTIEQTLAAIRERGIGEKVIYFYVVDADRKLVGLSLIHI